MTIPHLTSSTEDTHAKVWQRGILIAMIAFLTLIDLFGSQALLPILVEAYNTTPATMGVAVNACTIGMTAAGLVIAFTGHKLNRRFWIWMSLAMLSVPTALLGVVDDLRIFAALRVIQGIFMASAFTMTLTYLSERCTVTASVGAMAAYITGNVASNLFGRMLAVGFADHLGLSASFYAFSALNLAGAALAFVYFTGSTNDETVNMQVSSMQSWATHLKNPRLLASFAIGFLILFVFIGVFTYVNFVLIGDPYRIEAGMLGLLYLVFAPSILTTPAAGRLASKIGTRKAFWLVTLIACMGLAMLVSHQLWIVLTGLGLVAVGTFAAQAIATGFVGRTAMHNQAAANGIYLASYYFGGLIGSIVIGQIFENFGWTATIICMSVALVIASGLAYLLKTDIATNPVTDR